MHAVIVHVFVQAAEIDSFIEATRQNAAASRQEPGVLRFDVLQQADDPAHFILYEVYRGPEDQLAHRETPHYQRWKDSVSGWMAQPRQGLAQRLISSDLEDPA